MGLHTSQDLVLSVYFLINHNSLGFLWSLSDSHEVTVVLKNSWNSLEFWTLGSPRASLRGFSGDSRAPRVTLWAPRELGIA